MKGPLEAIKSGRLYNGYIICAGDIAEAVSYAEQMAAALKTTPLVVEKPTMEGIRALQKSLFEDAQQGDAKLALIYGDKMDERCQNAMLKTIEEQQEAATVVFAVTNMSWLLPTIVSRCVTFYPPAANEDELLKAANGNKAAARFSMGSKNKAAELCKDEAFFENRKRVVEVMQTLKKGEICVFSKDDKDFFADCFKYMLMFLRDALTGEIYWFFDMEEAANEYINAFTNEEIIVMIKAVEQAEERLFKNTNPMQVMDKLLLELWEVINGDNYRRSV